MVEKKNEAEKIEGSTIVSALFSPDALVSIKFNRYGAMVVKSESVVSATSLFLGLLMLRPDC